MFGKKQRKIEALNEELRVVKHQQYLDGVDLGPVLSPLKVGVLDQTEVWTDFKGRIHAVDEMSVRYKLNVLLFLERQAQHLRRWWEVVSFEAYESALLEDPSDEQSSVTWLHERPLVRTLMEQVARGIGGLDGDDPKGLAEYVSWVERKRQDALAAAEENTWD